MVRYIYHKTDGPSREAGNVQTGKPIRQSLSVFSARKETGCKRGNTYGDLF